MELITSSTYFWELKAFHRSKLELTNTNKRRKYFIGVRQAEREEISQLKVLWFYKTELRKIGKRLIIFKQCSCEVFRVSVKLN